MTAAKETRSRPIATPIGAQLPPRQLLVLEGEREDAVPQRCWRLAARAGANAAIAIAEESHVVAAEQAATGTTCTTCTTLAAAARQLRCRGIAGGAGGCGCRIAGQSIGWCSTVVRLRLRLRL